MSCKVVGVPEERVGLENIGVSAWEASLGQWFSHAHDRNLVFRDQYNS